MDELETGVCDWFGSNGQSFGYILKDKGGSIYIHYKHILAEGVRDPKFMEIREGDVVEFRTIPGHGDNQGTQATDVRIIKYGPDNIL